MLLRRSARCVVAALVGTIGLIGPGALPAAHASATRATGCTADAELKPGDVGSSVICVQYALGMIGLSDRAITGTYDEATADLVRWFQATHPPLRVDGRAGPQTLVALGVWSGRTAGEVAAVQCSADAIIRPGDVSPSVRCLQEELRQLGLYNAATTGVSDFATVDALKRYQASVRNLAVDGMAGPGTLAALGIWSGRSSLLVQNGTVVFAPDATAASVGSPSSGIAGPAPPGPWPAPVQPEKNWSLTAEGIPVYGNRIACTRSQADVIAYQFARDGADVATQQWAVYVASREGGCRFDAINQNAATQDDSHCTFQLNVLSGAFAPTAELGRHGWSAELVRTSLDNCSDAASDLWVYCGRGPWTPPYSCRPPWRGPPTPAVAPPAPSNAPGSTTPSVPGPP